jgi:hypothetical protein
VVLCNTYCIGKLGPLGARTARPQRAATGPARAAKPHAGMQGIYQYIISGFALGPLGRRERSELRAAKPHAGISCQHFACGTCLHQNPPAEEDQEESQWEPGGGRAWGCLSVYRQAPV